MLLLAAAASLGAGHATRMPHPTTHQALPQLLLLRGGVQPAPVKSAAALVERPAAKSPAQLRKALKNKPARKYRSKRRAAFDLQDAVTAALCLSAMGAAAFSNAPMMAAVPKHMKDVAWMVFGCALSSILLLLVRLCNYDRAMSVNRALGRLVLGTSTPVAAPSSLPSFAVASALGVVASFQSLPSSAG